jgi:CBS domain-containing protein
LCLAHRIRAPDTAQRIAHLVQAQALDAEFGRDLTEALRYLMDLKLRHRLTRDNLVRPSALSTMDRDQLKDALAIVKRWRALLRQRLRLDSL